MFRGIQSCNALQRQNHTTAFPRLPTLEEALRIRVQGNSQQTVPLREVCLCPGLQLFAMPRILCKDLYSVNTNTPSFGYLFFIILFFSATSSELSRIAKNYPELQCKIV